MIGKLGPGAVVGLRGPYGRGWPIEQARGRDVLLVAGGLGLAPMRPVVKALLADRDQFGRLIAPPRCAPAGRPPLTSPEYPEWERQGMEVLITVDRADPIPGTGGSAWCPSLFNRLRSTPIAPWCSPAAQRS